MEREHRNLLNKAKALQFHSFVPPSFRGDCLLNATYSLNRTPSSQLNGLTHYEILFRTPPSFHELKIFGCRSFAIVVSHLVDKFAPCAVKGVFVGYSFATKVYRILGLQIKQTFMSRDIIFYESIFPFQQISTLFVSQLFPIPRDVKNVIHHIVSHTIL